MLDNYMQILRESLSQKLEILKAIEAKSKEQAELISSDADFDVLDRNMTDKDRLITALIKLDNGFETLYENVRKELNEKKDEYTEEIREIQELIAAITDKSASIQAIEVRNKMGIENKILREKKEISNRKNASTVAFDYYKTSNGLQAVSAQFMDTKK
ncbi:MAG: flagellar export chaperone FlgN [Lachnospiraceae bacterium]|nr:flagellar export chaperone FlgN [Lachnospiraceae bacterium]